MSACPQCGGPAIVDHNSISCDACQRLWPLNGEMPAPSTGRGPCQAILFISNVMAAASGDPDRLGGRRCGQPEEAIAHRFDPHDPVVGRHPFSPSSGVSTSATPEPSFFVGSDADRQSVGLPGHCDRCVEIGHVRAHPGLVCSDVGCDSPHGEPPAAGGPEHDDTTTVDRIAAAIYGARHRAERVFVPWRDQSEPCREAYRTMARAALVAAEPEQDTSRAALAATGDTDPASTDALLPKPGQATMVVRWEGDDQTAVDAVHPLAAEAHQRVIDATGGRCTVSFSSPVTPKGVRRRATGDRPAEPGDELAMLRSVVARWLNCEEPMVTTYPGPQLPHLSWVAGEGYEGDDEPEPATADEKALFLPMFAPALAGPESPEPTP